MVSRLTDQKGFDLIAAAAERADGARRDMGVLGSGDRATRSCGAACAARIRDRVSATIGFDERLAHLIEAGADLFLMPSRFEPCGLNQMYSLRYGTVPIVRATGGLADTVEDAARAGRATGSRSGLHAGGAGGGRARALELYRNPKRWKRLAAGRDEAGLLLGRFGPGVCQSV